MVFKRIRAAEFVFNNGTMKKACSERGKSKKAKKKKKRKERKAKWNLECINDRNKTQNTGNWIIGG